MSRTYGKYVSYFYYFHYFSFFGGLSYCLFTSPFFLFTSPSLILEILGNPVFLKSQFLTTKFLSLFTPVQGGGGVGLSEKEGSEKKCGRYPFFKSCVHPCIKYIYWHLQEKKKESRTRERSYLVGIDQPGKWDWKQWR